MVLSSWEAVWGVDSYVFLCCAKFRHRKQDINAFLDQKVAFCGD